MGLRHCAPEQRLPTLSERFGKLLQKPQAVRELVMTAEILNCQHSKVMETNRCIRGSSTKHRNQEELHPPVEDRILF